MPSSSRSCKWPTPCRCSCLRIAAGALSDIFDKRRFLLAGEIATAILSAIFAATGLVQRRHPGIAAGGSRSSSAPPVRSRRRLGKPSFRSWFRRKALPAAISANSAGVNVSRAIGPAIAGAIIGPFGIAAPFIINAVSNFGVDRRLIWWREPRNQAALPAERFGSAIRTGFRYAQHSPGLRATFARAVALFFLCQHVLGAASARRAQPHLAAAPRSTAFCSERSDSARSAARSSCRPGSENRSGPAGRRCRRRDRGRARALRTCARRAAWLYWQASSRAFPGSQAIATINVSAQASLPDWVRGRGLATLHYGVLRIADDRKRGLGASRESLTTFPSRILLQLPGCCCDSAHLALEAANRRGAGPHALDVVAGADPNATGRRQ